MHVYLKNPSKSHMKGFSLSMLMNYYHVVEGLSDIDTIINISSVMYSDAVIVDVQMKSKRVLRTKSS